MKQNKPAENETELDEAYHYENIYFHKLALNDFMVWCRLGQQ